MTTSDVVDQDSSQAPPTPWGIGLVVAAIMCVFTTVLMVAFFDTLKASSTVLAVVIIGGFTVGLVPALIVFTKRPVWRFVAAGVAAGFLACWLWSIAHLLGS